MNLISTTSHIVILKGIRGTNPIRKKDLRFKHLHFRKLRHTRTDNQQRLFHLQLRSEKRETLRLVFSTPHNSHYFRMVNSLLSQAKECPSYFATDKRICILHSSAIVQTKWALAKFHKSTALVIKVIFSGNPSVLRRWRRHKIIVEYIQHRNKRFKNSPTNTAGNKYNSSFFNLDC